MNSQYSIYPEFNSETYRKMEKIHSEMKEESGSEEPDKEKMMKMYLREMNQAMMLGGQFKRNYGAGSPF